MKKRTLFLLTAIAVWIAVLLISWIAIPSWRTIEGGVWQLIAKASTGYLAFIGALLGIAEKLGWLKEKESSSQNADYHAEAQGEGAQAVSGENARAIQTGGGPYFEHIDHYHAVPEKPTPKEYLPNPRSTVYIPRGKIEDDVREALRSKSTAAIVGLHAPGGLGKSELARQAVKDLKEEGAFENTIWINAGEKTPAEIMDELLFTCNFRVETNAGYEMKKHALKGYWQENPVLLVLDDVRSVNAGNLADFLPPSPPCAALVTSRLTSFAAIPSTRTFNLPRMTEEEARALLAGHLSEEALDAEADAVNALLERCAYIPLALEISARRIETMAVSHPIAHFVRKIETSLAGLRIPDEASLDLFAVFEASYRELDPADQRRFAKLAVFHPSGFSPQATAFLWEVDEAENEAILARLQRLSLITPVPAGELERYRLHDLLDEYAAFKLEENGEKKISKNRHAEWVIALFGAHFTDDASTAPHVVQEMDNLRYAISWAESEKNGGLLAELLYHASNWLRLLNWHEERLRGLQDALHFGIPDEKMKAATLQAIGDVRQFRKEMDAALDAYNAALALYQHIG